MSYGIRPVGVFFSFFLLLPFSSSVGTAHTTRRGLSLISQKQGQTKGKVVYVCACLGTRSCSCMTEAKMEGPCACGTEGGPPMKPVPPDSDWAKENRDALAK